MACCADNNTLSMANNNNKAVHPKLGGTALFKQSLSCLLVATRHIDSFVAIDSLGRFVRCSAMSPLVT